MKLVVQFFLILGVFVFAFTNCSSSEKGTDKMKIEEAPPALSPGSASVEAEVVSVSETDSGTKCKIKILKVLEYGSSTPLLSGNKELEVSISKSMKEENGLKNGGTYKLLLRSREMKGQASPEWQISGIVK